MSPIKQMALKIVAELQGELVVKEGKQSHAIRCVYDALSDMIDQANVTHATPLWTLMELKEKSQVEIYKGYVEDKQAAEIGEHLVKSDKYKIETLDESHDFLRSTLTMYVVKANIIWNGVEK